MRFSRTPLDGVVIIDLDLIEDSRGFFARTFCRKEFEENALCTEFVQSSVSFNQARGTLRGMHFQAAPHEEIKLVSCISGAVYDVVLDLRPHSQTFRRWWSATLSAANRRILYVPSGIAHGFMTVEDHTTVSYQISDYYHPECARGVRWNDPSFKIEWPHSPSVLSERDRSYADFKT